MRLLVAVCYTNQKHSKITCKKIFVDSGFSKAFQSCEMQNSCEMFNSITFDENSLLSFRRKENTLPNIIVSSITFNFVEVTILVHFQRIFSIE